MFEDRRAHDHEAGTNTGIEKTGDRNSRGEALRTPHTQKKNKKKKNTEKGKKNKRKKKNKQHKHQTRLSLRQ